MRELLSLRRDEAPIIGEVYKYGAYYVKCVSGGAGQKCEKCVFNKNYCPFHCIQNPSEVEKHFEWIPENELETAADVKFRHIKDTTNKRPGEDEIFIASVGLVKLTDIAGTRLADCAACDLTMAECDSCYCLPHHCYRKIKQ